MEKEVRRLKRQALREARRVDRLAEKDAKKIRGQRGLLIKWYEAQHEFARLTADFYAAMGRGDSGAATDAILAALEDADYRSHVLFCALPPEDQSIALHQIFQLAPTSTTKQ
jgi:hypothetical protein